jgi:hypothetical protein
MTEIEEIQHAAMQWYAAEGREKQLWYERLQDLYLESNMSLDEFNKIVCSCR